MIKLPLKYFSKEKWDKIKSFNKFETPYILFDLEKVKEKYLEMKQLFSYAKIFYSVKANPEKDILVVLKELNSNFEISSIYELDAVLELDVLPENINFNNTIKKRKDISYCFKKGVNSFVTDSIIDLENIAKYAPNSKVTFRLIVEGSETADWPLNKKFGCEQSMVVSLIKRAKELGLIPHGISFHVGSQQKDIKSWKSAIETVKNIFGFARKEFGIILKSINIGGGFPASYKNKVNELSLYAVEIKKYLQDNFGDKLPEIIIEPGRALVADSGVLVSEVVLISRKDNNSPNRWVYTDVGVFNGLIETLDEAIKYPIYTERKGNTEEAILAGPTCDSLDIMYEKEKYSLPLDLEIGDRIYWFSTGAYTASYSSVGFNGFPAIRMIIF